MRHFALRSLLVALCILLFALSGTAAQAQFVIADDNRFQVNEQQLAQWVFGNRAMGMQQQDNTPLKQAERALGVHVDFVAKIGTLSAEQREKLELAGRGDIHRFLDRYEAVKREAPTGMINQEEWQAVWQKVQPLQQRYQAGLHGPGSLFRKAIACTLDDEQLAEYHRMEQERNRRHYYALVKGTVVMIEAKIPLTAAQRERLIGLVMEKTEPPQIYGQSYYQFYVVLLNMSEIEEQELKPIFLKNEWPVLQAMLQQARGMEHHIRRMQEVKLDD